MDEDETRLIRDTRSVALRLLPLGSDLVRRLSPHGARPHLHPQNVERMLAKTGQLVNAAKWTLPSALDTISN